jgi:hypothetical protein
MVRRQHNIAIEPWVLHYPLDARRFKIARQQNPPTGEFDQ